MQALQRRNSSLHSGRSLRRGSVRRSLRRVLTVNPNPNPNAGVAPGTNQRVAWAVTGRHGGGAWTALNVSEKPVRMPQKSLLSVLPCAAWLQVFSKPYFVMLI